MTVPTAWVICVAMICVSLLIVYFTAYFGGHQ